MMKKLRIVLSILLMVTLLSSLPVSALASSSKKVKVETINVNLVFDRLPLYLNEGQYAFIHEGSTYVPVRFVSYALQQHVHWDQTKSKVTVSKPTEKQRVSINEYLLNATKSSQSKQVTSKTIYVTPKQVTYSFGGLESKLPLGQSSYILNGSLYVPIRFISELAGTQIIWNSKTKTITGLSDVYKENEQTDSTEDYKQEVDDSRVDGVTGSPGQGFTGDMTANRSYESITSETESKLSGLYDESKTILLNIANQYLETTDQVTRKQLKNQGLSKLDDISDRFEMIIQSTESELKFNGENTTIISQYRKKFVDEINAGKALVEELIK